MNRANRIDSHPLQSKYPQKRTSGIFNMPAKHFINLTNGIETIRVSIELARDPDFMAAAHHLPIDID